MNQLVTEGERVYFEYCINCEHHQWCTKHSSAKYQEYFTSCTFHSGKNELLRYRSDLKIYANEIPPKFSSKFYPLQANEIKVVPGKLGYPRLGAFEIYYRGTAVFSKLATGLWPHPQVISHAIAKIQEEQAQKDREAASRPDRKSKKSRKHRKRKKSRLISSAKTSPSRGLRSTQEKMMRSPVRPATSKTRVKSKRSRTPTLEQDLPGFTNDPPSKIPFVKTTSSSDESNRQVQDQGIQADRFDFGARETTANLEEKKIGERPQPLVLIEEKTDKEEPAVVQVKQPVEIPIPVSYADPQKSDVPEKPETSTIPALPERPKTAKRPAPTEAVEPKFIEEPLVSPPDEEVYGEDEFEQEEEEKDLHLPKARYSGEDEEYGSGGFDDEGETSPVHPLRPVTKSYNVEIPMGKYTNKKITYENVSGATATFSLISSAPQEMEVKESEVAIEAGEKGRFKLQFNPVYEECEKKFYLYVDKDDEQWECFEFVVTFN